VDPERVTSRDHVPSRGSVAAEALRRGATSRTSVAAAANAVRRRATSRASVAAAALRRLAS